MKFIPMPKNYELRFGKRIKVKYWETDYFPVCGGDSYCKNFHEGEKEGIFIRHRKSGLATALDDNNELFDFLTFPIDCNGESWVSIQK